MIASLLPIVDGQPKVAIERQRPATTTSIECGTTVMAICSSTLKDDERDGDVANVHTTADELTMPRSDNAESDFRHQITGLAVLLSKEKGRVVAAMLGGARGDPVLAQALGTRWLEPRRRWGTLHPSAVRRRRLVEGSEPRLFRRRVSRYLPS